MDWQERVCRPVCAEVRDHETWRIASNLKDRGATNELSGHVLRLEGRP